MAEKRFIKGLFKDTSHMDQPNGSWRHARNLLLNSTDGAASNEGGTELSGHLGDTVFTGDVNYKVIGSVKVDQDREVFFALDVVTATNPRSEIGIWEKGVYTTLYRPVISSTVDLNFKEDNPIEGTFKIDSKGDLVVYWTDDLNPPRAFNINRQLRDSLGIGNLYGIPALSSINLLNLFPYSGQVPTIALGELSSITQGAITTGGGLRTGVYYLALAYVDEDLVSTNFLTVSNPVSITDEYDSTRPITKKDGAKAGNQTSKSITWRVSNLNLDYNFIKPVIIRKMGDATEAFQLKDLSITLNTAVPPYQEIMFSGLEGSTSSSVEEVIIDTIAYDTAKTINQLDGVLYLGNTTGSKDVGYQKYANNIKLNSVIKYIPDFSPYWATVDNLETGFANSPVDNGNTVDHSKSYRYAINIDKYKGYQRDEVYAFYIAFILNDGSMSYAYHIPGREAITSGIDYTTCNLLDSSYSSELDDVPPESQAIYSDSAKLFHFYDLTALTNLSTHRKMQYWENLNERYPSTSNFDVVDGITPLTGLQNKNVRHHHFPSNENIHRGSILSGLTDSSTSTTTFNFADFGAILLANYTGVFFAGFNSSATGNCCNWKSCNTGNPYGNTGALNPPYAGSSSSQFTASTDNTVVAVAPLMRILTSGSGGHHAVIRVERRLNGTTTWTAQTGTGCPATNQSYWQSSNTQLRSQQTAEERVLATIGHQTGWNVSLNTGDSLRVRIYSSDDDVTFKGQCGDDADDNCPSPAGSACNGGSWPTMWSNSSTSGSQWPYDNTCAHIRFSVSISPTSLPLSDYTDVKIADKVRALGFELDDIKIPQSIADKVQGFRIYRADRTYAQSTVLGQSIITPLTKKYGVMGLCEEVIASSSLSSIQQALGTLGDTAEHFLSNDAWANEQALYSSSTQVDQNNDGEAYGVVAFYDFNLLRTKSSLVPATHIKLEYVSGDYTWNGPSILQDKKMLTELGTDTSDSGAYEVTERWGWDLATDPKNCYPKEVNSAMFMGGRYISFGDLLNASAPFNRTDYELNRPIGQKAKTYLRGDSIFNGTPLGFGGKISNLGGESNIIFKLKDNYEAPSLRSIPDLDGTGASSSNSQNVFGEYVESVGSMLVATDVIDGNSRHHTYIANLKAFKTDVYKAIDTQDLVFTGFEITGVDVDNFVFDDIDGTSSGTFNTSTIKPEGIFGGDTFINRQGVVKSLSPLSSVDSSRPRKAIYYHTVESRDNIDFRHSEDAKSEYFPGGVAKTLLKTAGTEGYDYGSMDNIKYNKNYSESNNIRPAFPLPLRDKIQTEFPTRTHRSAKNDTTSLIDNWRIFLANQFKDLPKNRGELWKLSSFNNLLYFHMEDTLFAAKGKQSMSMKDGSEAFVGSGDIFKQEPNEVIQTSYGFGGTQSQYAAISTRYGYFFVDRKSRKIFLMKDKLSEISNLGLEGWFKDNMSFVLEPYGADLDNPIRGLGFHAIYDPKYKRILLTKREIKPTPGFLTTLQLSYIKFDDGTYTSGNVRYNPNINKYQEYTGTEWLSIEWSDDAYFIQGNDGWTISYYLELGVWGSFHDYVPYIYFNTSTDFYSLTDEYDRPAWTSGTTIANHVGTTYGNVGIWKHNSDTNKGILYQENEALQYTAGQWETSINYHPFEFEFIHNETKGQDTLVSSFNYTLETFNQAGVNVLQHGFTQFFLYNTFQISGELNLDYLVNTRRVGNNWKVNHFRDMAALATDVNAYYMQGTVTNPNIIGGVNAGTLTTSSIQAMFTYDGMSKTLNPAYLNLAKDWTLQRKFIDKWVGIRLIYDNISNNLLNLYSTNVVVRKMHR